MTFPTALTDNDLMTSGGCILVLLQVSTNKEEHKHRGGGGGGSRPFHIFYSDNLRFKLQKQIEK